MSNNFVCPVVKWVGGKRQLLSTLDKYIPSNFDAYCEPFIGGGALLFHLKPSVAIANDVNSELINMYKIIKSNVDELIDDLSTYKNEADYFYEIRSLDRNKKEYEKLSDVKKASRLLYLNKTCFNGLFRVNKSGEFNTPFGRYKNPNIVNKTILMAVSDFFNENDVIFYNFDFEKVLDKLEENTFVYLDPPYDPISDTSSFTGYNKGGFDKKEQARLKKSCDKLNSKGIKFLLSNSNTDFINELYKDYKIEKVKAKRSVNSVASKRGEIDEVLIRNYDIN
ncbi:MAG: DNA adenine methylase [Methanobrevibacter sp.]|jgi:DNA adenine methylase|nr:DNA adenine methylase [Methanobrevibacter sp.]